MDKKLESDCYENMFDAIPRSTEKFMNSIEIWHKAKNPKFKWTRFKQALKEAHEDGFIDKVGIKQGAQFYRYYSWGDE